MRYMSVHALQIGRSEFRDIELANRDLVCDFLQFGHSRLCLTFCDRWDDIEECWKHIEATHLRTPFQKLEWLKHWHQTIGLEIGATPVFITGEFNGNTVLLLPLTIQSKPWGNSLCWMGQDVNNYNAPLICPQFLKCITPEIVADIWSTVEQHFAMIDFLYLDKQPELLDGQRNPFVSRSSIDYGTQSHAFDLRGDWETLYRSKRKSEQRRKLRVKQKHLQNMGQLETVRGTSLQMKRQHIQETIAQKIVQLHATGARNPFDNAPVRSFLRFSGDEVLGLDFLQTYCLRLDNQPIALAFGFKFEGIFVLYQSSIKEGPWSKFSPGKLLLNEMIKDCFKHKLEVFDMSNGEFDYKSEWCDRQRNLFVELQPFTFRGRFVVTCRKFSLRVKQGLKTRLFMVRLICILRKIVLQVRSSFFGLKAHR